MSVPRAKPAGWKAGSETYWTKDSKYGVRYMCKHCSKETLGRSNHMRMHWDACPTITPEMRQAHEASERRTFAAQVAYAAREMMATDAVAAWLDSERLTGRSNNDARAAALGFMRHIAAAEKAS